MGDIVLPNLSYRVVGLLFEVHRSLGSREREKTYQKAVERALEVNGLTFEGQRSVVVEFGREKCAQYYLDLVVENLVALELKACRELFNDRYLGQIQSYLSATDLPLGILVNFHGPRLKPIRVLNPNFREVNLSEADARYKLAA